MGLTEGEAKGLFTECSLFAGDVRWWMLVGLRRIFGGMVDIHYLRPVPSLHRSLKTISLVIGWPDVCAAVSYLGLLHSN